MSGTINYKIEAHVDVIRVQLKNQVALEAVGAENWEIGSVGRGRLADVKLEVYLLPLFI